MYDLPSREDIGRCVVDKSVVLQRVAPSLVPRTTGQEKPERSRRAAS
jgi:ATP-dependent Clp protease ATP-binding subunit ClpX